jgi:hypothetical protein
MRKTTTKDEREARVAFTKTLLLKRGLVDYEGAWQALCKDLRKRYSIADARTVRALVRKAQAELRGEGDVERLGRPREIETLRHGDVIQLLRSVNGEIVDSEFYLVVINGRQTWLTSETADDLLLQKVEGDDV